jgi:hypothetical protein
MINFRHYGPAGTMLEETTALFQKQWQVYRKVVDNNYLFHREAYDCLHRILVDDAVQPFRFLDLACGDGDIVKCCVSRPGASLVEMND